MTPKSDLQLSKAAQNKKKSLYCFNVQLHTIIYGYTVGEANV